MPLLQTSQGELRPFYVSERLMRQFCGTPFEPDLRQAIAKWGPRGAITDLLDQGVPLELVQMLVGHAVPRTTRLYDRRDNQVMRTVVDKNSV